MQFRVRHVPAGAPAVRQETLEAEDADSVRRLLGANGGVVLDVRALRSGLGLSLFHAAPRLDVAWWCRELETLLRAGMTAVEAIETVAAGRTDAKRDQVHASLLRALRQGQSLSRAMRDAGVFAQVLVAGVTASERTSTLADALRDYLKYDDLLQRLRRKAVSAALYPAMVVALGAVISLFLLLYVIPRFSRMYGESHQGLSASTEAVLWLSRTLRDHGSLLVLLVLVVVALLALLWRSGRWRAWLEWALDSAGPLGKQWDQFRLAQLYHAQALLVRGGYNFDEALKVCQGFRLGSKMSLALEAARGHVARGKPASKALALAGLTEVTTERLLGVGERSGAFDTVLQVIAERHAQRFTTFVERATRVLEPLLLLAVALVVGSLVVMMYMPIFDIAGGLGGAR